MEKTVAATKDDVYVSYGRFRLKRLLHIHFLFFEGTVRGEEFNGTSCSIWQTGENELFQNR